MTDFPIDVLLIEDDPGDARLIREMLLSDGSGMFALTQCAYLESGMTALDEQAYDVILLDLTLPDSAGIDTLFKLQSAVPDVAIVVLTGLDDMTLVGVEAVKGGAQDYLVKGDVDAKLLRRSIRYAIERHEIEERLRRSEEEYRSLIDDVFDTSMVAVIILNADFEVVWCNEATEIYFGFERENILGRDKRHLIDEELKCVFADPDDYMQRLFKAYDESSFSDRFECYVLPEDERDERWLEHWSQPIRDGMFAGGRIEQYTDITDRKMLEFAEKEQREFAEALSDIATILTSSLDLDEVLERILTNLDMVMPHDSASITIMEENYFQVAFARHGSKRDTQEIVAERQFQLQYKPLINEMLETHQPLIIDDIQALDFVSESAYDANVHAYIGAPIRIQDETIGFINGFSEKPNFFEKDHAERLSAFAELAAIALQNAKLYDESQRLAAVEERQRLARELHDSVSQTLFTCRTMAETALRRWDKDPLRAHELVNDVHQLTMTALSEMRILLLELRPSSLTQISLKQLFEQYLQPIQDRREFELTLEIDDLPSIPPDVQIALYRITQEALNNIDKHAQADHVQVHVAGDAKHITLEISDDGQGFVLDRIDGTSLGLTIMQERAEEIGAQVQITTNIGQGTQIRVRWDAQ